jgi:mono/diheme cytochrome c family protein
MQRGDDALSKTALVREDIIIPPAPVLTPAEALETFELPEGFEIELVASEPLINDPIQVVFDDVGRMWVVEWTSYMPDIDATNELEPTCEIAVLSDTDGDGVMDKRVVFLDGLALPRSVAPTRGGALVIAPPDILFCRDTDGDGYADERNYIEKIDPGLAGHRNPEHAVNGLLRTLDNRFHCANGGYSYEWTGELFERVRHTGGGQWGIASDDMGRIFYNSNSDALRYDQYSSVYAARNPGLSSPPGMKSQVVRDQKVYSSRVNPGINRGYQPQMLTAEGKLARTTGTCSPYIQRGDGLGQDVKGDAFVCEPCGNLVLRYELTEDERGVVRGEPARKEASFLTSTDERFRPVNIAGGPDGCIYIVDLYRGVLQHRNYVTSFLRRQVEERELETPLGLGRIWRVKRTGRVGAGGPELAGASWDELAILLGHPNGWWRDRAQRAFVEEGEDDPDAEAALHAYLAMDPAPLGWVHALWSLDGLKASAETEILAALAHADARVVETGVRTAERHLKLGSEAISEALLVVAAGDDFKLRRQVGLSLGEGHSKSADAALVEFLASHCDDEDLRRITFSGVGGRELELLSSWLAREDVLEKTDGRSRVLRDFARGIAREGKMQNVEGLVAMMTDGSCKEPWQAGALCDGVQSARDKDKDKKPVPMLVSREPAGLMALEDEGDFLSKKYAGLKEGLIWPGKPGVEIEEARELSEEEASLYAHGADLFMGICAGCHQPSGRGEDGKGPPLRRSPYVLGEEGWLVRVLMHGLGGEIKVMGKTWNQEMPALAGSDRDIAAVLTYIRREWGHTAEPVSEETVAGVRAASGDRQHSWTVEELKRDFESKD